MIFPTHQLERWLMAASGAGLSSMRICHVYTLAHKEASRVMVEFSKTDGGEPRMESILIEKSPGEFSEAYKRLTKELYTKW